MWNGQAAGKQASERAAHFILCRTHGFPSMGLKMFRTKVCGALRFGPITVDSAHHVGVTSLKLD
jgi:hypothetical protein